MHARPRGTRGTAAPCVPAGAACRQRWQAERPRSHVWPPCSSRRTTARSEEPSCIVRPEHCRHRRAQRMHAAHGCTLPRALYIHAERSMNRSSKAPPALQERARTSTHARPARNQIAWSDLGRVGSTPCVRLTPASGTVPFLVGASKLTRWRLGCDTSSTINI